MLRADLKPPFSPTSYHMLLNWHDRWRYFRRNSTCGVLTNPLRSCCPSRNDKLICVDVKATDQMGRIFVVEIQIVVHASFAKRALFYACAAYADQLQKGQGYGELKATYCFCLLMRKLWDTEQLHHHYQLVERTTGFVMDESIEIHTAVSLDILKNRVRELGTCS
jgi:predicted transposase/invertase (TIGR01784 family)